MILPTQFCSSKDFKIILSLFFLFGIHQTVFCQFGEYKKITNLLRNQDLELADFDADGDLDILGASIGNPDGSFAVVIYENVNGLGTEWAIHDMDLLGQYSAIEEIEIADFDEDGWLDFVVGGADDGGMLLFKNTGLTGEISFTPIQVSPTDFYDNLEAVDLNSDGHIDLIATVNAALWWSSGDGTGAFTDNIFLDVGPFDGDHFERMTTADLDNDGDLDVVCSKLDETPNYYTASLLWYENEDGLGNFSEPNILEELDTFPDINDSYKYLKVSDMNADGLLDLLLFQEELKVKFQTSLGVFADAVPLSTDFTVNELDRFVLVDMDGDGDEDIVHPGSVEGQMRWYRNADGQGDFELIEAGEIPLGDDFSIGAVADADNDGDLDFFFQNYQSGQHGIRLYFNEGNNENFGEELRISNNVPGFYQVFPTDFDGDGDEDVLFHSDFMKGVFWSENLNGFGLFAAPVQLFAAEEAVDFILADMDDDGDEDIVVASRGVGGISEIHLYERLDAMPNFAPKKVIFSDPNSNFTINYLMIADWDNDGDSDVLYHRLNSTFWLTNQGNLDFSANPSIFYGFVRGLGNLSNDAFPDLVYTENSSSDVVLLKRSSLNESEIIPIGDRFLYNQTFVEDMDNDGDDDLVFYGYENNPSHEIRIFFNQDDELIEKVIAENLTDFFTSTKVLIADLDGDGQKDFCWKNIWFRQTNNPLDYAPIPVVFGLNGDGTPPIAAADMSGDGLVDPIFHLAFDALFWRENQITDGFLIGGSVFFDDDEDCTFTPTVDTSLYGWIVKMEDAEQNNYYLNTSLLGTYGGFLPDSGDYLFNVIRPSAYWGRCVEDTILTVNNSSNYGAVDFPVYEEVECPLLGLNILAANLRPCLPGVVSLRYCNYGTIPAEDIQVIAQPEEWLLVDSISVSPTVTTDSTYIFDLPDLGVGECNTIHFYVKPDCNFVDVGDVVCLSASITPDEICLPLDSLWDGSSIIATGNCENDTTTFELKNIGAGDMQEPQQYRIEFIVNDDIVMLMQVDTFQLPAGAIKEIQVPTTVEAIRIEADQSFSHPLMDNASAVVVNCSNPPTPEQALTLIESFPDQDGDPFFETQCITLTGSYDPNKKECFPLGIDGRYIENDWELEYLIHFQNTGNDTAFVVEITDKLSEHLDLSTLRVGASSHDYIWDLAIDRTLTFRFEDILLVDSLTNEIGSQGYVQFFISPLPDLPVLTDIDNQAFIYFDFNLPIETNTVRRTIRKPVTAESENFEICAGEFFEDILVFSDTMVIDTIFDSQEGCFLYFNNITALQTTFFIDTLVSIGSVVEGQIIVQDTVFVLEGMDGNGCETTTYLNVVILTNNSEVLETKGITLFPNPVSDQVFVFWKNKPLRDATIEIINWKGQLVSRRNLTGEGLSVSDLAQGVYVLRIKVAGEWFHRQLVVF